ncbi:hydrogenase expression protein [Streptomyces sp. NPDC050738]|uniref:hydrogenase expression protein n=1 Tax=Streptomyces sp. NPDC050738 TaxID=3154744 RepID=UPI003434E983
MSMWSSLEPDATSVEPGASASVRLRLRNTGDTVEEYRLTVAGGASGWARVEPEMLRLYPGGEGTAEITFTPPRTPDVEAGPVPFGLRIVPHEHPQTAEVVEGRVTVGPFTQVHAELVPRTVRGRFRGRGHVVVDNLGNRPLTAAFSGRKNGDAFTAETTPAAVQPAPGRAGFADLELRPARVNWFGTVKEHSFTVTVGAPGSEQPGELTGTWIQPPVVPRWLLSILAALVAVAVVLVALWFRHDPGVKSQATAKAAALPSALPSPSLSAAPSPTQQTPSPSASAGGGGEPSKKAAGKPKPKSNADEPRTLRSHANNLPFLDVFQGRTDDGTKVTTAGWSGENTGKNQWWTVHRFDDGTVALSPGNALNSVLNSKKEDDTVQIWSVDPVQLRTGGLPANERWRLKKMSDGYVEIISAEDGKCLTDMTTGDAPAKVLDCPGSESDGNYVFQAWKFGSTP